MPYYTAVEGEAGNCSADLTKTVTCINPQLELALKIELRQLTFFF